MAAPTKAGIEGFTSIASNIFLYRPQDATTNTPPSPSSPSLIVLCSWMGAAPKHIVKYTTGYQKLFPSTSILLVQSSMSDTFASDAKQSTRLTVAAQTIRSFKASNDYIILHAMSNGGGIATCRIATILGSNKIFNRMIFDCMPGKPNIEQGVRAVSVGLPKNWLIRFLGIWLVRIWMHVGMFIMCTLLRREDILTRLRRQLNDPGMFDSGSGRMYMYSRKDQLITHGEVHEHAQEARSAGWKDVKEVIFPAAPHCGLLMEDAEKYWRSIREFSER